MNKEERYALWTAAESGDEKKVRDALTANPKLATEYEEFHYQPTTVMTLLHVAASRDHVGIMRLLLDAGADPAALAPPTKGRLTPLHCAARGKGPAVQVLLDAGVDPNICVKRGVTPLYGAAYNGNLEGCRLLLEHGADPKGKPSSSAPLLAAAMESQIEVIELLLNAGAKITQKDNAKNTALNCAARRGNLAVNRFLLERGLDPDQANKKGETPRSQAPHNLRADSREQLIELYDAWGSTQKS